MGLTSSARTGKPWREPSVWDDELKKKLIDEIERTKPDESLNLIVIGPVGSGKSSFINAVFSVAEGRKVSKAQTGCTEKSYTLQYTAHIQKTLLNKFVFRDTSGLMQSDKSGLHVDDFIYLLKGNIKNLYKFNPAKPITHKDDKFRENPEPVDVNHCVIFVISAVDVYNDMPAAFTKKIRDMQASLSEERIPRTLILTKADELCELVREDVSNMFWSRKIEMAVKKASDVFQIEQASVHPVVNFEISYTLTLKQTIPILLALKQSIQYADDHCVQTEDDKNIR